MGFDQKLMTPYPFQGYSVVSFGGRGLRSEIGATIPFSGLFRSHPAVGFDQESGDTLPNLGLFGAGRLRVRAGGCLPGRQVAGKTLRK